MTDTEVMKCIDDSAVFYLDFFGDVKHMESVDTGLYKTIQPKANEQGIKFIYDLRLDHLTDEEAKIKISELKESGFPIWWPLCSDRIQKLLHGKDYVAKPPSDGDEFYMALFQENCHYNKVNGVDIKPVVTKDDFKTWADIVNLVFAGGYTDIHPDNHFSWCEKRHLMPNIVYCGHKPVSTSAVLNNNGVASLEFVATLTEYRRKGYARAASIAAIQDAFTGGAKIITLRAFQPASLLYQSLGFEIYY